MKSTTYSMFQEFFQCKVFINEALSKATESDGSQRGVRRARPQDKGHGRMKKPSPAHRPGWV
jgi:hypothetical protein